MWQRSLSAILVIAATAIPVAAQEWRKQIVQQLDAGADRYGQLSRTIWETAEVGYKETKSSALLRDELKAAGFRIDEGVAGMPTGFVATWGSGKPVIGIMGEFDALPGLSQETVPEQKARVSGGPGHGCGHNLLGVASLAAALAVKAQLESRKLPGTIRYYGTPAEEGGNGKVYMVRAGLFNDADVVLHWHPNDRNIAARASTLAVISAKFRFKGIAAHAASAPDKGRSALDAVMVMTHAVDLLREHIPQESRLHYIITKGGVAPNIVPESAEIYMYARHPQIGVLDGIWERILKTAEAGALATGTTMEVELVGSTPELLPNEAMTALLDRNLREVGGVTYTAEERAFAGTLQKTFMPGTARDDRRGHDDPTAGRAVDPWIDRCGRRELGGAERMDAGCHVCARDAGPQLAGHVVHRRQHRAQRHDGGRQDPGADRDGSADRPGQGRRRARQLREDEGDSRVQVAGTRRGRAATELPGHEVRVKIAKASKARRL